MAINCYIGLIYKNTIESIYCHNNGQPSVMASLLLDYYNDINIIKDLINLGDISRLDIKLNPKNKEHDFFNPEPNVTVAYFRDRDRENWLDNKPENYTNLQEFIDRVKNWSGYGYVYDDYKKQWFIVKNDKLVRLTHQTKN